MSEPTQKQILYAEKIADACGIDMPKEFTRRAYWKFINDNQGNFAIARASWLDEYDYLMLPDEGYFC